jgi:hypothetical protein
VIWWERDDHKVLEPKITTNRVHINIDMPDAAEIERLCSLGARVLYEVRNDDGTLPWTGRCRG